MGEGSMILFSYPIDEIDYGIHDREREKHDDETDDGELQGSFCLLDTLGIPEGRSIEKRGKDDTTDREYRTDEDELIGKTRYFCLYTSCDSIIIRCDRTLWVTTLEVFRDAPAAILWNTLGTISREHRRK